MSSRTIELRPYLSFSQGFISPLSAELSTLFIRRRKAVFLDTSEVLERRKGDIQ
jgi:hypothetical protein